MNTAKLTVITPAASSSLREQFKSTFDDVTYPHLAPFAECDRLRHTLVTARDALVGYVTELAARLASCRSTEHWGNGSSTTVYCIGLADTLAGLTRIINALGEGNIGIGRDEQQTQRLARYAKRLSTEGIDSQLLKEVAGKMALVRSRGTLAALEKVLAEIDGRHKLTQVTKD